MNITGEQMHQYFDKSVYQYKVTREYTKFEFDSHIRDKLLTWLIDKNYDFEFTHTYRQITLDANYYFRDSKQAFCFELAI